MKHYLFVGLILLTIGCNKHMDIGLRRNNGEPQTILIMGQSNALKLNPMGYAGWNSIRHSSDNFINCAVSGSYISQWRPESDNYQACLQLVGTQHVDLIIWYQGENETGIGDSMAHLNDYAYYLTGLFRQWRHDFGNDVPIFYCQLGLVDLKRVPGFALWDEVKRQQAMIYFPNAYMIKTDGIRPSAMDNDGLHFPPQGYYNLGKLLAERFITSNLE